MTVSRDKVLKRVGGSGHWVSIVRRPESSKLYLRWWNSSLGRKGNYEWMSLKHSDMTAAEGAAKEAAAGLLQGEQVAAGGVVTLAYLFSRYEDEVTSRKKDKQQREDRRRFAVWQAFLGADFDPLTLTVGQLREFEALRRSGGLRVPGRALRPVRNKSIREDEAFLSAVLGWASSIEAGVRLLPSNPMAGYRKPRELNPKRPRTSYDTFLEVEAVADSVDPQGLFRGLHALVEALGWRVSAVCQLRASDFDLRRFKDVAPHGRVRKSEETDKVGVEQWVPLSTSARAAVDLILERNLVVGEGFAFPAPRGRGRPWTRHHARALLLRAYEAAGIPEDERFGWHSYRRKWADERKHLPRKDVAAAGGWLSERTLDLYEQPDQETILVVVDEPKKLRRPRELDSPGHSRNHSSRGVG